MCHVRLSESNLVCNTTSVRFKVAKQGLESDERSLIVKIIIFQRRKILQRFHNQLLLFVCPHHTVASFCRLFVYDAGTIFNILLITMKL